ncbi:unnamed protein product [Caenorhabditis sp. 36 PRJEB53466]|nr:unnamed protein product [Caenorhabditis sp. 36 PRJEB53466]
MADTDAPSSSIPTTSGRSNARPNERRGGRSNPRPRQEKANPDDNQVAGPSNPRGGPNTRRGSNRGRAQRRNPSENSQQRQHPNFQFNPNAMPFNPEPVPSFDSFPRDEFNGDRQRQQNQNGRTSNSKGRGDRTRNPPDSQVMELCSQNQNSQNSSRQLNRRPQTLNANQNRPENPRNQNQRGNRRGRGGRHRDQREDALTEEETRMLADKPLRERLIYQLQNNKYECPICYNKIFARQGVWSCKTCYQIFHISTGCITDWAKSSRDKEGANTWRCPTCQTENETMPYNYNCFCGRQRNPTFRVGETPHSCGDTCGRSRKFGCPHPCTELCHPGPCVECQLYTTRTCSCGKIRKSVRCGTGDEVKCDQSCGKLLSCGIHNCEKVCHTGDCGDCTVVAEQECFCGREHREVPCHQGISEKYVCGTECDKMSLCGVHKCTKKCHENECGECEKGVNKIRTCPCGRHTLQSLGVVRTKCTDKVPTCDAVCDKWLSCGPPGDNHRCQMKCHEGSCPPCALDTFVVCRCGSSKGKIPCDEYLEAIQNTGEYLCTKRCGKKKSCGKHKCQETCCIQDEHFCLQMCNKRLSCGIHTCENVCHNGVCRPCLNASFDEQYCHCGSSVRYPPIPCGARLPVCTHPCARPHSCNHTVTHKCHGEQGCPPCTQLTDKTCYGGHTVRKNIPCHIESVSCGVVCQKRLRCGVHVCQRSCHGDECEKEGEKCTKKCEVIRELCEHACALPCHEDSPCEPSPCKAAVRATCECGRIRKEIPCCESEKMIQMRIEKEEEKRKEEGESSTFVEGTLKRSHSFSQLNCLKCDEECKKVERNRKVAEALEVETDEYGNNKLTPTISFPCYLKEMVKTSFDFVKAIEKTFCELILLILNAEAYNDVSRAHLPPMNIEKRRFVHEYANYFNIVTESVDSPPKRSIVLTAIRGKSHQPLVLISDLINYKGALKTPGPAVIRKDLMENALSKKEAEEGTMKPLRCTEKMVVRREARPAKVIATPIPIEQQNRFAYLGSVLESDAEGPSSSQNNVLASAPGTSPSKDWWDDEESGWQTVQQKEYVVEIERELTEEEIAAAQLKAEEEQKEKDGPTWEDLDGEEVETMDPVKTDSSAEPVEKKDD